MRILHAVAMVALLAVGYLPVAAAPAEGGLALAFSRQDGQVTRVAMTALAQAPVPTRASTQPHWTVTANDARGALLWRWQLPAPRRFHPSADGRSEFVVAVPAVAPGTQLSLRDQHARLLWSEQLGGVQLQQARERALQTRARVAAASVATSALVTRVPEFALTRELIAAERSSPSARVDAVEAEATPAPVPNRPALAALPAELPRAADSIDADTWRQAPLQSVPEGGVLLSVIGENGVPPTVPFPANLFRDGEYLGTIQFDAQGQAMVALDIGFNYAVDLRPPEPLVAARRSFFYNGTAPAAFVLEVGWLIDVFLHDSADQPIAGTHTAMLIGLLGNTSRVFPVNQDGTPGRLRFAVPKHTAFNHYLEAQPASSAFTRINYPVGNVAGPHALTLRLASAAPIPGRVQMADGGELPPGGQISCGSVDSESSIYYMAAANFETDGQFVLRTPLDLAANCSVWVPSPALGYYFARTFHAGDTLDFSLLRGVPVRFLVQDEAGQAIASGFDGSWFDAASNTSDYCYLSPCELHVPQDRAVAMSFRFGQGDYAPIDLPLRQYTAGSEHVVVAIALHHATGTVLNLEPLAASQTRVRVFDANDRFIVSSLGPHFDFVLPSGSYRFEADANIAYPFPGLDWTFRNTANSGLVAIGADAAVPDLVLPTARGTVEIVVDRLCGFEDQMVRIAFTAPDGRRFDRSERHPDGVPVPPRPPGQCASVHTLGFSPGHYVIEVAPLGWPPQTIELTVVAGQTQQRALVFALGNRTRIWQGSVVDAQQQALPDVAFWVYDREQQLVTSAVSGAQGQFALPFAPGWSVKTWLLGSSAQRAVSDQFHFGANAPGPLWQLDRIDFQTLPESGLMRIYGNGDRLHRRNIVFIAEGYTGVSETYTDLDFNGQWTGVLWEDLNGSGVYEGAHDRAWQYGGANPPQEGTVPTAQNEPFVDQNGDGVLSLDDPAMFVENVRSFMRSLLGSDVWDEHRDSFNAWILFAPSAQAGYDVVAPNGQVLIARDTLYGASLPLRDRVLNVDRTAMAEVALAAIPEVDLVVAMVNEPLPGSRANASSGSPGVIVVQGGIVNNSSSSTTESHEMGHYVAGLCDEYSLDPGFHYLTGSTTADLGCANATVRVDPGLVPWSDLLPSPPRSWPSVDRDGSIGLFEGASYVFSGAYRPSMDSTMRNTAPFFNAPSRRAIEQGIAAHASAATLIFQSGFE